MRCSFIFGFWLFLIVSWGHGNDSEHLRFTGVLKGYFLTPKGEVVLRSVNLTSQPVSEQPKEEMHLLWAGYYFEGQIKSVKPVRHIVILAGNHIVWKRELPRTILQGAVPDLKLPLQLHTRYGMDWKVQVGFDDGGMVELPLRPIGVRFKPPPPLKIDWLDLARIRAIKTFLARYGDHLFPGWNAERVSFALLGEDGQWVFINHPKPPKDSKRYRGPSPLKADIFWIDHWLEFELHPEAAETGEVNGMYTVILPFHPYWFALPEYEARRNAADALMRLATLLHECFHAWYAHQLFPPLNISLPANPLKLKELNRLTEVLGGIESDLLDQALVTQDVDRRNEAVRQFLALRQSPPKPEHQLVVQTGRIAELSEGVASILEEQAMKLLMAQWQEYFPMLKVDLFLPKQPISLPPRWKGCVGSPYFTGAAQLTLLERLGFDWKHRLRATDFRTSLDEILKAAVSKAIAWRDPSPEQQAKEAQMLWRKVEEQLAIMKQREEEVQKEGFEEFRKRLWGEKLGLWVKISLPEEVLRRYPLPKVPLDGRWQEDLSVFTWDCRLEVNRLCWVSQETMQSLVARVYLPMEKDEVFWLRWRGRDLEVKGEGLQLYVPQARLIKTKGCLWLVGQSRSLSGEQPLWRRVTNMKRVSWLAVSLSLLLAASASIHAQIPEGVTVMATITGNFRDADTGQIAYLTLNGLDETNNPPGNWHCIVGEPYTLSVVMESAEPEPMSLVLLDFGGQELARAESTQPTQRLSVQGQTTSPYGCQTKYRARVEAGPRHFPTCEIIWGIWVTIEPYHVPIPPPQYGTLVVHVFDGPTGQPLRGAGITIPEAGISDVTNEQGIWRGTLQVDPKNGTNYTVIITGEYQSVDQCVIQRKIKLYAQGTHETHAWIWQHAPIVGRIQFEGVPDDLQLAIVKATKGNQTLTGTINFDGSFVIPGDGGAPEAGQWTVTVQYPGALSITPPSRTVIVPNDCRVGAIRPGAHSPIDAGTFVIKLPSSGDDPGDDL